MTQLPGFSNRWTDFPDYILGITKEIWEERGVASLHQHYASDIAVRSPMGVQMGNKAVIASTMATIHEFPDRALLGEDVIWSDDPEHGLLSSHRLLTKATHLRDGQFGAATDKPWVVRVIADCAARAGVIYDEWLVRDYGGIVRQLGMTPREVAAQTVARGARPFRPEADTPARYQGRGNANEWGQRYADTLTRLMDADFNHIFSAYDRAAIGEYAGAQSAIGRDAICAFWLGLRSAFPDASFAIHHQIGREDPLMPPRAALRWSLDGTHSGWGAFGAPTGAPVHVFGMSHAEYGPWGLRREYGLYDEIAIWAQILAHDPSAGDGT
ncbi:MAG: ester cyclase [Pseudomonadota bacterium]